MGNVNRHGLSRSIPSGVRQKIRQDAGFGCVICGNGITEYEHIDPEWCDAKVHDPDKMTLLCSGCHSKKTRGIYSKEKVYRGKINPKCKQEGYSSGDFDFGYTEPLVQISNIKFKNPQSVISILGESIISITKKEGRYLLNAMFEDNQNELIRIEESTWYGKSDNWDIEIKGKSIIIRRAKGDIALKITNYPNDRLEIEKIDILFKGYKIYGDKNGLKIIDPENEIVVDLSPSKQGRAGFIYTGRALGINSDGLVLWPQLLKNVDMLINSKKENYTMSNQTISGGSIIINTQCGGHIPIKTPNRGNAKKKHIMRI